MESKCVFSPLTSVKYKTWEIILPNLQKVCLGGKQSEMCEVTQTNNLRLLAHRPKHP